MSVVLFILLYPANRFFFINSCSSTGLFKLKLRSHNYNISSKMQTEN